MLEFPFAPVMMVRVSLAPSIAIWALLLLSWLFWASLQLDCLSPTLVQAVRVVFQPLLAKCLSSQVSAQVVGLNSRMHVCVQQGMGCHMLKMTVDCWLSELGECDWLWHVFLCAYKTAALAVDKWIMSWAHPGCAFPFKVSAAIYSNWNPSSIIGDAISGWHSGIVQISLKQIVQPS